MSWVQLAVVNNLLSNLSSAGGSAPLVPIAELGVDPARIDNTFDTYARSGMHNALGTKIRLDQMGLKRSRSPRRALCWLFLRRLLPLAERRYRTIGARTNNQRQLHPASLAFICRRTTPRTLATFSTVELCEASAGQRRVAGCLGSRRVEGRFARCWAVLCKVRGSGTGCMSRVVLPCRHEGVLFEAACIGG